MVSSPDIFSHVTGHIAPGTMFIFIGCWWLYHVVNDIVASHSKRLEEARPYASRAWYGTKRPARGGRCAQMKTLMEPIFKIFLGSIGSFMELTSAKWQLLDSRGDFRGTSMNNFSHATMFSFFVLSGVIDTIQHYGLLAGKHLSKVGHLVMAFAFFIEGFLFYFHLDGRSDLDSHSHIIIYWLCFVTSIVFVGESVWVECGMLGLARCFLVILQGTWFYQIAYMLYGPNRWSEKSNAAAMFIPIAFSWHCFVLIIIFLTILILGSKCCTGPRYCSSDCEVVGMEHLLGDEDVDNEQDSKCT